MLLFLRNHHHPVYYLVFCELLVLFVEFRLKYLERDLEAVILVLQSGLRIEVLERGVVRLWRRW